MTGKINYNIPIVADNYSGIRKFLDGFFYYGDKQYKVISSKGAELKLQETQVPQVAKQNALKIALLFTGIVPLVAAIYKLVRVAKWHSYKKITVEPLSNQAIRIDQQGQSQLTETKLDPQASILKTLKSLEEKVKNKDRQAIFELGLIKHFGIDCLLDREAASELFDQATDLGHPAAMLINRKEPGEARGQDEALFLEIGKIASLASDTQEEISHKIEALEKYINYDTLAGKWAAVQAAIESAEKIPPDYEPAKELGEHGIGRGMFLVAENPNMTLPEKEGLFKKWANNDLNAKVFYAMAVFERDEKEGMELFKNALKAAGSDPLLRVQMVKLIADAIPVKKRLEWYTYCAEQGDEYSIVIIVDSGRETKEGDMEKVKELADRGNEQAIEAIHFYHFKRGEQKEASDWLDKYAEKNSRYALEIKGRTLIDSCQLDQVKKGMEYLKKAGEKNALDMDSYGYYLHEGVYRRETKEYLIPPSIDNAIAWYQECIDKGRFVQQAKKSKERLEKLKSEK